MTQPREDTLAIMAEGRSRIYGFLSGVYRREPTEEFIRKLREPACLNHLKDLGLNLDRHFESASCAKLAEELSVEYTRLFIGPGSHVYPYESAYQASTGIASARFASTIKTLIQATGLEYRPDFSGHPDHISVELEFMATLSKAELSARKKRNRKNTAKLVELERKFLQEHLFIWVGQFSRRVIKQAKCPFYRELAKLTEEYIAFDGRQTKKYFR